MRYKKYTRFITFCVKPETYEQIDRYCKDLNLSTSEFLRDAVDKYLLDKTVNNNNGSQYLEENILVDNVNEQSEDTKPINESENINTEDK